MCAERMQIYGVRAVRAVQSGKLSSRRGFGSKGEGLELGRKGHGVKKLFMQKA